MPTVFLSYSHDSDEHTAWVECLAQNLNERGVDVLLDKWEVLGADINSFMERSASSDKVLVVCTEAYVKRANQRERGVGVETTVITGRLYENLNSSNVIPILRKGDWDTAIPIYLKGRKGVDFRSPERISENFPKLVEAIFGSRSKSPAKALGLNKDLLFSDSLPEAEPPPTPHLSEITQRFRNESPPKISDYSGCIMIVDISDFSEIGKGNNYELQLQAISALDWYLHEVVAKTLKDALGENGEYFYMNSLDGAVIAITRNLYRDLVNIAHEWIDFMKNSGPQGIGFRVGLHKGDFMIRPCISEKSNYFHIFGTGINDCDRIARIGDAGDVFASQAFIEGWIARDRDSAHEMLFPRIDLKPDVAYPKRGRPQAIRMVFRLGEKRIKRSRYFTRKHLVDSRIKTGIMPWIYDEVIQSIIDGCGKRPKTIDDDDLGQFLGLRVSFFVPKRIVLPDALHQNDLICISRFGAEESDEDSEEDYLNKATTYARSEGPVGMVFNNYNGIEPYYIFVNKLPDPKRNKGLDWMNSMEEKFNLPKRKLEPMKYRGRAFIATPVVFSVKQEDPSGVLCIDFLNPLAFATDSFLRQLADFLFREVSPMLAAHWELRTS